MTIRLVFEQHPEPEFECEDCGHCCPDHWTISLVINGQEFLVWEYNHDGHFGCHETQGEIVTIMRDILLTAHSDTDHSFACEYQRKSIIDAHMIVEGFSYSLYNQWSKAKAYALALEDDGWAISCEIVS